MSLLEQNTIKKGRINEKTLLEPKKEFKTRNDKKYKIKPIINSVIYGKEVANN